jgi:hypothetical protein
LKVLQLLAFPKSQVDWQLVPTGQFMATQDSPEHWVKVEPQGLVFEGSQVLVQVWPIGQVRSSQAFKELQTWYLVGVLQAFGSVKLHLFGHTCPAGQSFFTQVSLTQSLNFEPQGFGLVGSQVSVQVSPAGHSV